MMQEPLGRKKQKTQETQDAGLKARRYNAGEDSGWRYGGEAMVGAWGSMGVLELMISHCEKSWYGGISTDRKHPV